jgi:hypothetical protein
MCEHLPGRLLGLHQKRQSASTTTAATAASVHFSSTNIVQFRGMAPPKRLRHQMHSYKSLFGSGSLFLDETPDIYLQDDLPLFTTNGSCGIFFTHYKTALPHRVGNVLRY